MTKNCVKMIRPNRSLSAKINELTMKRYDENTTTGVINVVDEDEEKSGKPEPEEEEVAPRKKLISATVKDLKKRGRKQAESTSQTKLTKFFKSNKN